MSPREATCLERRHREESMDELVSELEKGLHF